jgi:hypothetical protein
MLIFEVIKFDQLTTKKYYLDQNQHLSDYMINLIITVGKIIYNNRNIILSLNQYIKVNSFRTSKKINQLEAIWLNKT